MFFECALQTAERIEFEGVNYLFFSQRSISYRPILQINRNQHRVLVLRELYRFNHVPLTSLRLIIIKHLCSGRNPCHTMFNKSLTPFGGAVREMGWTSVVRRICTETGDDALYI